MQVARVLLLLPQPGSSTGPITFVTFPTFRTVFSLESPLALISQSLVQVDPLPQFMGFNYFPPPQQGRSYLSTS